MVLIQNFMEKGFELKTLRQGDNLIKESRRDAKAERERREERQQEIEPYPPVASLSLSIYIRSFRS